MSPAFNPSLLIVVLVCAVGDAAEAVATLPTTTDPATNAAALPTTPVARIHLFRSPKSLMPKGYQRAERPKQSLQWAMR
jgi:hypothetical protein